MSKKIIIGIDPDVDKSGVAIKCGDDIKLFNLTFFQLYEQLAFYKEREVKPIVYVECGYLNKANFQKKFVANVAAFGRICNNTGENFQVSKKIVEMCNYLGLECVEVKPTASKVDAKYFKAVTGISYRTNQEQRDAMMLIVGR